MNKNQVRKILLSSTTFRTPLFTFFKFCKRNIFSSIYTRTKLCKFVSVHFPQCKLQVIFNSNDRLRNFFSFKDKIPLIVRSHLLYCYMCDCKAIYIGKTRCHYGACIFEHLGISLAMGVNYTFNPNNNNNTAILNRINHTSCKEEKFCIIGSAKTNQLLCIKTLLLHKNETEDKY